jgi:tryptophan-rich sensory protein
MDVDDNNLFIYDVYDVYDDSIDEPNISYELEPIIESKHIDEPNVSHKLEPAIESGYIDELENSESSLIKSFVDRLKRVEYMVVYASLVILSILFITLALVGPNSSWYSTLKQPNVDRWVVSGLWIVGTILSYVSFYFVWENIDKATVPLDLILSIFFLIGNFIFVGWVAIYYYAENLGIAFWVSFILFTYNFWLFLYFTNLNVIAGIFLIPNLLLYIYLMYACINLAFINNIPL